MPSRTLGHRLPDFVADYNASVSMDDLVEKYGRTKKSLEGIALRNGGARPNRYPTRLSHEQLERVRLRYIGGANVDELAADTKRSRQTLWAQVFRHLTPIERAARRRNRPRSSQKVA